MREELKVELKQFLDRFGLGIGDLKTSPDYEQEMLIQKGSTDLSIDCFNEMVRLFTTKAVMGPPRGNKFLERVGTGVQKTMAGWTMEDLNNNKVLYKHFNNSDEDFTYGGHTYRKIGKW